MKLVWQATLTVILGGFFLWQAWSTISKYQDEKTTLQVDREEIHQNPVSIPYCQALDLCTQLQLMTERDSNSNLYTVYSRSLWRMMGVFYFPRSHFVRITCTTRTREFLGSWNLVRSLLLTRGRGSCNEPSPGASCSDSWARALWRAASPSPAPQWAGPARAPPAVSPLCIRTARKSSKWFCSQMISLTRYTSSECENQILENCFEIVS